MSLLKKFKSGMVWSNTANIVTTIARFISGIYLARNIDPMFFGEQALILSTITIFFSFLTIGENYSIISSKIDIKVHIEMQLALRLIIMIIISLIFFILFSLQMMPINHNSYMFIMILFTIFLFNSFTAIYYSFLSRKMMFKTIATIDIISVSSGIFAAVTLTHLDYKLEALIALIGIENLARTIFTFILVPKRFKPVFHKKEFKNFFQFAKYVFLSSVVHRLTWNLDKLIVGNVLGIGTLGYYNRSFGIAGLLKQMIVHPFLTVFNPLIGALQKDDKKKIFLLQLS